MTVRPTAIKGTTVAPRARAAYDERRNRRWGGRTMRLNVADVGAGPVVVLLHGFPFDHTMWAGQIAALAPSHRVIAPDLRGYGQSEAPEGSAYGVDDLADDVLETLDAIGVSGPMILGGLSMGGYVALSIADRHPGRLRGLMLMDTRAGADTPEAAANRLTAAEHIESSGETGPLLAVMLTKLFAEATRTDYPERVERIAAVMRHAPPAVVAATLRGLAARPDRTAVLPRIVVPTLVVVGAEDAITPPAEARAMAAAIPGATLVEVPAAGHLAPVENPGPVNTAIGAFLDPLVAP
jgi:pimeloyl-ACP methyl ester carboxylesterase